MGGKIHFRISSKIATMLVISAGLCISSCRQLERPFVPEPVCPVKFDLNFDQCPEHEVCTDIEKCRLIERLELRHVQVTKIGEDFRIIIPSDYLFEPKSANFNHDYLYVLPHVASLLHCYSKVDVRIAGFTDCWGDPDHNRALSLLQAQMVAKFLWRQGTDTRLLYARGFGAEHPIASNQNYHARARNRRIEITFRDIPSPNAVRDVMARDLEQPICKDKH